MEKLKWGRSDPFTHTLVVGPTRSGKTATILKPMIYQLLLMKKRGVKLGFTVVEPKGDVAQMVADMSEEMGLDYTHIDPTQEKTAHFNPMEGEKNAVAEATVIVLKSLFGKQDAFFATVQELSARNVTKLLKELRGDNFDIIDLMKTLRDTKVLENEVTKLKALDGDSDLVHFFESELLGESKEKYKQFIIGLRAQLENIVSNDSLREIMTGDSDIDIDRHYEEGGILAVNTALGMLRSSGDAFGKFLLMHLQNGAFKRKGTEDTRVPHFLIVDEYSRYINPDVEIFLSLAAEYRVAGVFATQSLGQLEIESGHLNARAMKRSIMASCRNKITFSGITSEDAREFADEFGKDKIIVRQSTYKNRIFLPNMFPDSFRDTEDEEYRFDPTDIRDGLGRFNYIHQMMQEGVLQKPGIAEGLFVPRNWKELREWETKEEKKEKILEKLIPEPFKKKKVEEDTKESEKAKVALEEEQRARELEEIEKITEYENMKFEMEREELHKEYLEKERKKKKPLVRQVDMETGEILDDGSSMTDELPLHNRLKPYSQEESTASSKNKEVGDREADEQRYKRIKTQEKKSSERGDPASISSKKEKVKDKKKVILNHLDNDDGFF